MITIFDLARVLIVLVSVVVGYAFGSQYGVVSGIVGFVLGLPLGLMLGAIPVRMASSGIRRELSELSKEALEARLQGQGCFTPNFVLAELRARGIDIQPHLSFVLTLMQDAELASRTRGYAALLSSFDEIASSFRGFNPLASEAECRRRVMSYAKEHGVEILKNSPQASEGTESKRN